MTYRSILYDLNDSVKFFVMNGYAMSDFGTHLAEMVQSLVAMHQINQK